MIFKIFLDTRVEQTLRYTSEKKLGKNTKKWPSYDNYKKKEWFFVCNCPTLLYTESLKVAWSRHDLYMRTHGWRILFIRTFWHMWGKKLKMTAKCFLEKKESMNGFWAFLCYNKKVP
jgi:hypothetical protein